MSLPGIKVLPRTIVDTNTVTVRHHPYSTKINVPTSTHSHGSTHHHNSWYRERYKLTQKFCSTKV